MASEKHVPQVGIEFLLLGVGAAFHVDASEMFAPCGRGGGVCGVEIPLGEFAGDVLLRVGLAYVAYGHLGEKALAGLYVAEIGAHACRGSCPVGEIFGGEEFGGCGVVGKCVDIRGNLLGVPAVETLDGAVEIHGEIYAHAVGTAPEAPYGGHFAGNR